MKHLPLPLQLILIAKPNEARNLLSVSVNQISIKSYYAILKNKHIFFSEQNIMLLFYLLT